MELTKEQSDIVNHDYQKGQTIVISAFAGTGKTTTLQLLANKFYNNTDYKCLYIAFNKSVQKEAERKFEENVECRTSHSLCWEYGKKYRQKFGNIRLGEIKGLCYCKSWNDATIIKDTIYNFIYSADKELSMDHIPKGYEYNETYYKNAKRVWNEMIDVNSKVVFPHDAYLKLAQLDNYQFTYKDDNGIKQSYDVIYFDEFQDSNPVTLDLINNQKEAINIFVGDKHQQIYQFRGSVNALDNIKPDKRFNLTESFRFGENIAFCSNVLLDRYKKEKLSIKGFKEYDKIGDIKDNNYTFISRTNAGLFIEAFKCLRDGKSFKFVGDIGGYNLDDIEDIYRVEYGGQLKNKYFLSLFKNKYDLADYVKDSEDFVVASMYKIMKYFKHDLPMRLKQIKEMHSKTKYPDVLLTTCHKAKGLEWENVKMANDYMKFVDKKGNLVGDKNKLKDDEINIVYVAMTRATKQLELNSDLKTLMRTFGL